MATYFDMTYAQELMRLRQESMDADRMPWPRPISAGSMSA